MTTCLICDGTGLVAGKRTAYENGKWVTIPTKYRKTCPSCRGERETE